MRIVVVLAVAVAVAAGASVAHACRCVAPSSPREDLASTEAAFYGPVVKREVLDEGSPDFQGDEFVLFTFRVDVDYKDNLDDEVQVATSVQDAACGFDAAVGDELGMLLERFDGEYVGGACSLRTRAFLDAGQTALPDPNATPPSRFLAAGGFGAPRSAGLDAAGRLVGYGRGPGSVTGVSVCPGGRAAVEAVSGLSGIADGIGLRDLDTLAERRRVVLPLRRTGRRFETIGALRCLNASGSRVSVFVVGGDGGGRLIALHGQRRQTVWEGAATTAAYRGRRALVSGAGGTLSVGARSGEARPLPLGRARLLSVSPDGATLALATHGSLRLLDLATGQVIAERSGVPAESAWLTDERFAVRRRAGRPLRILGPDLGVVAGAITADGPFAAADGDLVVIDAGRLERYDPEGEPVSTSEPLFSDQITGLTALPSRSARIACMMSRWERRSRT